MNCQTVWKNRSFEGGQAQYQNGVLITGARHIRLNRSCMPTH
jgi:hypothetical protein